MKLVPIHCSNPFCREVMKTGKPQIVGRVEAGAKAELRCAKCKHIDMYLADSPVLVST